MQIFAAVLAGVVLLAGVAGAGYWIGRGGRNLVQTDPTTSGQSDTTQHAAGGDIDLNIADGSDSQLDSRSAVASAVSPSVVGILTYSMSDTSAVSSASGVIMDEQGYIITNDHVYSDIPSARFIIITNEGKQYDAEFVAGDVRSDLAVLKADFKGDDVKPATFGKISTVKTGDQVLAIGSPGGILLADTVTSGIISATERWMSGQSSNGNTSYSMRCIQTDAAINPGNSGGALVNMQGQVIGIPSSKIVATGYEGIGFAIPVDVALNVAQSLVKNHYVADRAKLGVTYQTVSPVTAKQQNMRQGLYISTIDEESDLTEKGIESGDIILTADGKDAVLNNNMLSLIASKKPGDTVKLTIYKNRTGQTVTVNATLLADKGSSSYSTQAMETTTQNPFFPFR